MDYHRVSIGDTLSAIAARYSVPLIDLMRANRSMISRYSESDLASGQYNVIFPGQVLTIPARIGENTAAPVWSPPSVQQQPNESSGKMPWLLIAAGVAAALFLM